MDRSHPLYLAAAIVFALLLQFVLLWKLRRSLPAQPPVEEGKDPETGP
ncbi:MAG: hypothetical protein K6T78_02735 [Alicyclobacillus sp.]|nr:hypothetical protein [Alicyclobacillus sp.]